MSDTHPVITLRNKLEDARLKAVVALAAKATIDPADLKDLAHTQIALTAVREAIGEHSARVGWSGDEATLEGEALKLIKTT